MHNDRHFMIRGLFLIDNKVYLSVLHTFTQFFYLKDWIVKIVLYFQRLSIFMILNDENITSVNSK